MNEHQPHMRLLDPLFTSAEMREVFCDERRLQSMLDFEAALARVLARTGVAPASAAPAIEAQCQASLYSLESLAEEASLAGNLAIPLIKALTKMVARSDERAAGYVHWGATSQDVIDTATVLQLRAALEIFDRDLTTLMASLARLAGENSSTLLAGRTWLQQGPPVTLGLKAAGWLDAMMRHRARVRETTKRVLTLQFGGAVGTLAAFGNRGLEVAAALAKELKLTLPEMPWHTHRDRFAEVAAILGLLAGSLGKIARDISLLSQTEVGEAFEPSVPGRGGSSTMPHKRNPVGSAVALAAAIRVPPLVSAMLSSMVQEHERGLGGWHAEWEILPEICLLTSGALARVSEVIDGLEIDAPRMDENLEITHGLILAEAVSYALAPKIGRLPAHDLIEQACRHAQNQKRNLLEVLLENPKVRELLSPEELARLLAPGNFMGSAEQIVKNVLLEYKSSKA